MKHLGDITLLDGSAVPPVNVVIGGSPCQDLSVAGTQKGLDGERSALFLEQIRLIKEMRENDRRSGRADDVRPRYMVWENVPGAFSSNKGEDFRTVLEETARVIDEVAVIPRSPNGKWTASGCIMGNGWSIAWRVFDAQFWGVPQRRRRIALVADFGGETAPEILFERQGLSGDTEQSRQTRKTNPPHVTGCAGEAGERLTYCIQGNCIDRPMTATCNGKGWKEGTSYTLNTVDRPAVVPIENYPQDSRIKISKNGVFQCLSGRMGTGRGNAPMVLALDRAAYNQGINAKYDIGIDDSGKAYTCVAKGPGAVCIGNGQVNTLGMSDTMRTLDCMHDQQAIMEYQSSIVRRITPLECERLQGFPDGWTDIGDWTDNKGKVHKCTDSARYKALGNSISLPNWIYVLNRLSAYCDTDKTMASLFDGIGGFPLIWETLNGKGTCIWGSEIDDFPMAVTKIRMGE